MYPFRDLVFTYLRSISGANLEEIERFFDNPKEDIWIALAHLCRLKMIKKVGTCTVNSRVVSKFEVV